VKVPVCHVSYSFIHTSLNKNSNVILSFLCHCVAVMVLAIVDGTTGLTERDAMQLHFMLGHVTSHNSSQVLKHVITTY
jgi:hypothetical protein